MIATYPYAAERARFEADAARHVMTIAHDEGVYRSVRFKAPDTGTYWFDIVTSPGLLTINGDMGCYVFSRLHDMFRFFDEPQINPDYWGEKLLAQSGYKVYSPELFRQLVTEAFTERAEDLDTAARAALWEQITAHVLSQGEEEHSAREAVRDFNYGGFEFVDSWEWSLHDFDSRYLWCCHAIRWAVEQYRTAKP